MVPERKKKEEKNTVDVLLITHRTFVKIIRAQADRILVLVCLPWRNDI